MPEPVERARAQRADDGAGIADGAVDGAGIADDDGAVIGTISGTGTKPGGSDSSSAPASCDVELGTGLSIDGRST